MARGWESKGVEEQIGAREAASRTQMKSPLTPLELEQRAKREGLLLARARTVSALEATHNERYRELLERTLAHLDAQLAELEPVHPDS